MLLITRTTSGGSPSNKKRIIFYLFFIITWRAACGTPSWEMGFLLRQQSSLCNWSIKRMRAVEYFVILKSYGLPFSSSTGYQQVMLCIQLFREYAYGLSTSDWKLSSSWLDCRIPHHKFKWQKFLLFICFVLQRSRQWFAFVVGYSAIAPNYYF
jgi:hypothetical protein